MNYRTFGRIRNIVYVDTAVEAIAFFKPDLLSQHMYFNVDSHEQYFNMMLYLRREHSHKPFPTE